MREGFAGMLVRLKAALTAKVGSGSALLAAIFFVVALTPSLMPRSPVVQGVVGGIAAAVGFEIGHVMRWLWEFLELPRPQLRKPGAISALLLAATVVTIFFGLWHAAGWQNATRAAIGLEPVDSSYPMVMLPVAVVFFFAVWAIIRLLILAVMGIHRLLNRWLPRKISFAIGLALVVWLTWAFATGILGERLIRLADASFELADSFIDPDIPRPQSPLKTGSDDSLVGWQALGVWGRAFVASAPTREEIAALAGPGAMEPIRVYVGLRAADTGRERAELALRELIRAGAFDRSYLVIVNPTGTGWMDPARRTRSTLCLVAMSRQSSSSTLTSRVHCRCSRTQTSEWSRRASFSTPSTATGPHFRRTLVPSSMSMD